MRLPLATIVLGALLGTSQASTLLVRQQGGGTGSSQGSSSGPPTTSQGTTTSDRPTNTGGGGNSDTTVTDTTTVSADAKTVSKLTTVVSTTLTTITNTVNTAIPTTTIVSNQDVATFIRTHISVITVTASLAAKRFVHGVEVPRTQLAQATDAPAPQHLNKRATFTSFVTTTVGGGGETTVFSTATSVKFDAKTTVVTVTSTDIITSYANAKTTTTIDVTSFQTTTVAPDGVGPTDSPGSDGTKSTGLSGGAKAGIGIGAGLGALAVVGIVAFFCVRSRRRPKPDTDGLAGASEVPVGPSHHHDNSMSSHTAGAAAFLAPGRTPIKNTAQEGYRGTAMGDGRAGYAKPDPYGSAYTSPATTMTNNNRTSPPGADSLPEHPHPDTKYGAAALAPGGPDAPGSRTHTPYTPVSALTSTPSQASHYSPPPPQSAELGTDSGGAARWHESNAAEIDSQPVLSHQSGPVPAGVYEMPAQHY